MKKSYAVITGASSGIGRAFGKTACGRRIPSGTGCAKRKPVAGTGRGIK